MLFLYKPNFRFQPAQIVKKVCLPAGKFEQFLKNPLENLPCISENVDLMREDDQEVFQCLLVTGEGRRDGVLVQSEGYDYARYASYVPDAPALEHESLSEFGARLSWLVDWILREKAGDTMADGWDISYDEIEEQSDLSLSKNPELAELVADMIQDRLGLGTLYICSDHLEIRFSPEHDPEEQRKETGKTLAELLCSDGITDLYLIYKEKTGYTRAGRINRVVLEEERLEQFQDVLQARVCDTRYGAYGLETELEGVPARRMRELSRFLVSVQKAKQEKARPCLKDLLDTRWENLHLVHDEIDYGLPHTIVELDAGTLTETGKKVWADVLEAKVMRVFQGYSGLQMELSGVKASRLDAFSAMLAGYCSVEDYESWVNEPEEELAAPVIQKN